MAKRMAQPDRIELRRGLERIADELEAIGDWLDNLDVGEERVIIMLEDAWRTVAAAGWELERHGASNLMVRRIRGAADG